MAMQAKAGFIGLYTNAAETQVPPGGLLEAENVVVRRPGCVESRDGVTKVATVAGGYPAWGFSWRGTDYFVRNVSNVFDWRDTAGNLYAVVDNMPALPTSDPQPLRRDIFSRAEARGGLYLPYNSGVLKLESEGAGFKASGLPVFAAVTSVTMTGVTGWLQNNEQVAYRVVCRKTDANGLIVTSIPTGQVVATNGSGGARNVLIQLVSHASSAGHFDYFDIYRTRTFTSSVTPDDEMQLVGTIPAAGSASFVDTTLASARGATLYTSPSRGGIAQQNERPPASAVVAAFRGALFFANIRGPRRVKFSRTVATGITTSSGVGRRSYTATSTAGNNQLTLLSSTAGLEKGQVIVCTTVPADTYITNISGTTVTMSANANTSVGGLTYDFYDAVLVGGSWVPTIGFDSEVVRREGDGYQAYSVTPPEGGYNGTYVLETIARSSTADTIQATHGSEYNPPLPNYDGTPLAMSQDTWPGAVYWSKTDEPEHVAPGNYAFVGDQRKAILGMVPTRDALFLLKEDGVFRLTGFNGEWRIDPFDPNCFCVLPMSVQNLNGRAVFLSAEGVVALDDGGVQLISRPVNDQVKLTIDQVMANWRSTGFYEVTGSQGASYSAVFDRENEYTLMRSSSDAHLVFNSDTAAWTTWKYYAHASESLTPRAVFGWARRGTVVYTLSNDYYETILSTAAGASYARYDRITSVTVNSYAAGTATLSGAVTALEDDIIEDGGDRFWRVTADVSGASVPVALGGGVAPMATGPAFLYRALRCKVVTTGYTEPGGLQKVWGAVTAAFTRMQGAVRVRWGYRSSQSATWVEEDAKTALTEGGLTGNGYTDYEIGAAPVAHVPRAHKMAWLLRLRMRWAQAFGEVRLEGLATAFETRAPGAHGQVEP